MKLIDRLSLHRLISMVLGFVLTLINMFFPTQKDDAPVKPNRIIKRRKKSKDSENE